MNKGILKQLKNIKVLEFNVPNRNGRIYNPDCVDLDDPILNEMIQSHMFFGELGFPEDGRTTIDMMKASHCITKLYKKEDGLYADIDILDTLAGRTLLEKLNKNNFRTRGTGTLVKDSAENNIVEDYQLITIDYTDVPA